MSETINTSDNHFLELVGRIREKCPETGEDYSVKIVQQISGNYYWCTKWTQQYVGDVYYISEPVLGIVDIQQVQFSLGIWEEMRHKKQQSVENYFNNFWENLE